MNKPQLLSDENLITESDNKEILLTSHRIRYFSKSWGKTKVISMMLENISSIEVHYSSNIIILAAGCIFILAGLIAGGNDQGDPMILGLIVGSLLILSYFITRKHVVTISSDGGTQINLVTGGMKSEVIIGFIDKIEKAKSERFKTVVSKEKNYSYQGY
jgi:hypothetical protein